MLTIQSIRSRVALALGFLVLELFSPFSHAFELITRPEMSAEANSAMREFGATRSLPLAGAPRITVVRPVIGKDALRSPIGIELQFTAGPDSEIEPSTFRVFYGFLRLDLTDRILKQVKVQSSGLRVVGAEIPAGTHRLLLSISDGKGRATETELRLNVE